MTLRPDRKFCFKKILEKLEYIDKDKVPLIKARIARELSDNEIYLCEVLMENVLDNLESNEIAALLSVILEPFNNIRDLFVNGRPNKRLICTVK